MNNPFTQPIDEKEQMFIRLTMNPILRPARKKAIRTLMKRKMMSFRQAQNLQARRIVESKFGLKRNAFKKTKSPRYFNRGV